MNQDCCEEDATMLRDAQDWSLLSSGDPATRTAFVEWVLASPAAVSAFLMDTMLDVELSNLDSARQLDLDALIAAAVMEQSRKTT